MNKKSFEYAMNRLEEIAEQLEQENTSLEDSLSLFEEGAELYKFCHEKLEQAQVNIKTLIKENNGFSVKERSSEL